MPPDPTPATVDLLAGLNGAPVPVDTAVARVGQRRRQGTEHAHALDAQGVRHLARLFEVPSTDEGMEILLVES